MAVSHSLSIVNDNLSGFDPVDGESEGTTIGKNYLVWQIFQGLKEFDSNVVMVSSSGDTPTWLASQSGSIMTEPAKNAATTNQNIRWFYLNDIGLSGPIPNAFVYEWGTTSDVANNNNLITVNIRHVISGSAPYVPFGSGSIVANDNAAAGAVANCMVAVNFATTTITTMNLIPKIIYWKSDTSNAVISIDKRDATYDGYLIWHNPTFTGYRSSLSSSFTDGSDFRCVVTTNAANGASWIEGFTQKFETNIATYNSYLNPITSGLLPTTEFIISGSSTVITSKLKFGVLDRTTFKAVSEEIDGIELANTGLVNRLAGSIIQLNSKYYITGNTINDGVTSHKVLFQLEN